MRYPRLDSGMSHIVFCCLASQKLCLMPLLTWFWLGCPVWLCRGCLAWWSKVQVVRWLKIVLIRMTIPNYLTMWYNFCVFRLRCSILGSPLVLEDLDLLVFPGQLLPQSHPRLIAWQQEFQWIICLGPTTDLPSIWEPSTAAAAAGGAQEASSDCNYRIKLKDNSSTRGHLVGGDKSWYGTVQGTCATATADCPRAVCCSFKRTAAAAAATCSGTTAAAVDAASSAAGSAATTAASTASSTTSGSAATTAAATATDATPFYGNGAGFYGCKHGLYGWPADFYGPGCDGGSRTGEKFYCLSSPFTEFEEKIQGIMVQGENGQLLQQQLLMAPRCYILCIIWTTYLLLSLLLGPAPWPIAGREYRLVWCWGRACNLGLCLASLACRY